MQEELTGQTRKWRAYTAADLVELWERRSDGGAAPVG